MTYVFAAQKIRSKEGKKRVKKPEFKQSFEKLGLGVGVRFEDPKQHAQLEFFG